jgi:sec-independent protein translocase protein TatC
VDNRALPLTDHLAELRSRLVKIVIAVTVGFAISWSFREVIFAVLLRPALTALPEGTRLQALAPTEIFFTYLKGALLAGFVLSLPFVLWQVWAFISPGLYATERRFAIPFVLASTGLFLAGATFGYSVVFPLMFDFLSRFESDFVAAAWTMREVFALTTRLFLAFGVAFELPVLVFFLSLSGIVDAPRLLRGFPYAVLLCFVLGAALTPPDWVSQIFLALPMCILYLVGVGVAHLFAPRGARTARGSEVEPSEIEGGA